MLEIAIVGSRNFKPLNMVDEIMDKISDKIPPRFMKIITGGAPGVDKKAETWCIGKGISCEVIRPIDASNKLDYLFRNVEILTKADYIIAFWDGKSRGTKFVIDYCQARDKSLEIIKGDKIKSDQRKSPYLIGHSWSALTGHFLTTCIG